MRYTHNENWLVTSDGIGRVKYWKGRNELVKVCALKCNDVNSALFCLILRMHL